MLGDAISALAEFTLLIRAHDAIANDIGTLDDRRIGPGGELKSCNGDQGKDDVGGALPREGLILLNLKRQV